MACNVPVRGTRIAPMANFAVDYRFDVGRG